MKAKLLVCLVLLLSGFDTSNFRTITGTVTDTHAQPLPGVLVTIKGTSTGTTTDAHGKYALAIPKSGRFLRFSYVGFKNTEVKISSDSIVNVRMHADFHALSETVLVGFGQQSSRTENMYISAQPSMPYISGTTGNTENYNPINENGFQTASSTPVTTFSIDVDRAAYSNVRRFLNSGQMPPVDAVRIEEMINYFDYDYPQPKGTDPFSVTTEISESPWNAGLKLVHIGLQARKISTDNLPASNLVFLIDVSGSMSDQNKLPLLKQAFKLLVDQIRPQDKISIVVYAGAAGVVLSPTSGNNKIKIKEALDALQSGGSTAGGEGINLAYKLAQDNFMPKGNNRIILATDGDFNVGASSEGELQRLVEEKRKGGVFLSILGFGMSNYKDSHIETLADKGNGNYAYIDNIQEAQKVFIHEFGGTLFTLAKDVKLQIEFNPVHVQAYRLIGYENRAMKNEEFHEDKKDAGDMGSGHSVTAIYEIVPTGVTSPYLQKTDALKYQKTDALVDSHELLTLKVRFKKPDSEKSVLLDFPVKNVSQPLASTSDNFRFAASVAEFGLLLRQSEYKGNAQYNEAIKRAKTAFGKDEEGYRSEFVRLVKLTQALDSRNDTASSDRMLR
ncbi:YfbK domain-containing protein [Dyadobacter sp. 32]|uniref:YfbK domain-containing protein n=1 Tax=Dyadobacter sp. 32 TaxID=538966 RepID=UPI0011EFF3F6